MKQVKHHRELINSIIKRHAETIHGAQHDVNNQASVRSGSVGNMPKTAEQLKTELGNYQPRLNNSKV